MKTYTQKVEDYVECDGWDVQSKHTMDLECWADEIWVLSSSWSPYGASAYLTFLVDPVHVGNRNKGQFVWGLGCSKTFPSNREHAESCATISFNKDFKHNMMDFQLAMESLRKNELYL